MDIDKHDTSSIIRNEIGNLAINADRQVLGDCPNDYISIQFQKGPIGEVGVNGCQIEDVIDVLVDRLSGFQAGEFKCRENALAITKLEEARLWLNERTRKRQVQGVEGKNVAHK